MKNISKTSLFAYGSTDKIIELEKSLPIEGEFFDFRKIIQPPKELNDIGEGSPSNKLNQMYDWSSENWGTPSNGAIYKTGKVFLQTEMALEIQLISAINSPNKIINKIIEKHRQLFYLMHTIDYMNNELIAFHSFNDTDFKVICESSGYLEENCEKFELIINLEHQFELKGLNLYDFQRDFIGSFKLGRQILKDI